MSETSAEPAAIGPFVVLRRLGEGAMGVVYAGYDVLLDRKVAIKLVRPQLLGNPAIRERMVREAQAMARLSSAYVVQVFQVGEHEDSLYLAMEYIEGKTLTVWLETRTRPWQVVLRTLCDAGRGLAAAHEAGLVHRDFKPDNVLVDASGHPRVLDFGLVRTEVEGQYTADEAVSTGPDDAPPGSTMMPMMPMTPAEVAGRSRGQWATQLTQHGGAIGTPAYMSPEQHFARTVGPKSDQFSFAITLYEALYGVRPFPGETWEKISYQVQLGTIPPPPPRSRVPRRVFKVIARALATDPEQRWPSLDAMIATLERDPSRVRLRAALGVGLLGATVATTYVVARAVVPETQHCEASARELTGVWDPERRAALTKAFTATGVPFASDSLTRAAGRIDAYADAWVGEHRAACEAHASGVQTSRMMDLRVACLGRRKVHLQALVDLFGAADRAVVENAVQAVAALPSLHACADVDALLAGSAPPNDTRTADHVEQLRGQLARAAVLEHTGQFGRGIELAAQVRGEAEALGYAPLTAEAALAVGRLYMAAARWAEADAALTEAPRLGIAHDLHAVTAEAVTRRIFVVGAGLGHPAEALAVEPLAEALVQRARDDGRLSALLHNNLGAVYDLRGDTHTARVYYQRTIAELQQRPGPSDPLIAITHNNIGNMDMDRGDFDSARAHFSAAKELFTTILGEGHPFVAHALAGLGDADARKGAHAEALGSYAQALGRMEAAYGSQHLYLLQPLTGFGQVYARLGQADRAAPYFTRAVKIADDLGAVDVLLGRSLEGLADLAAAAGSHAEAINLYSRAARVYAETTGADANDSARVTGRANELAAAASVTPAVPGPQEGHVTGRGGR
ncbi:MAG TPA: serine/threonine-protein kinase [Nannocystis sp.]|jgi:tetratricopeptide (TPR) repeat protein/tRNA A-37 threonylcarbamoyl transferase component Bud32